MKMLSLLILLGAACFYNLSAQNFTAVHPVESAINRDYLEKRITLDEAILYKFYHLFDKSKLPAKYHTEQQYIAKCGTMIFVDYVNHKDFLSEKTIEIIESYMRRDFRNTESQVYISPGGNFELTYDTAGTHAVPKADANGNGIPDFVEKAALYCDFSWFVEIDSLGFTAPPINPPTTRYQINFESMGYYGYCSIVSSSTRSTRITLNNTFLGFPPNTDPDGNQLGAMKVTIAHEFKHASQYKTSRWTENDWVEVDATWAEDIVYDATNDYYNYLTDSDSPLISPGNSLDGNGSGGSYEDCIWQHYMSETHGNEIIRDFWTRRGVKMSSETVLNSYDSTFALYGSSLAEGFRNFTAWNYMTGTRAVSGFGYGEASAYPTSSLCRTHSVFPASGSQCTINHLAANFIHLLPGASDSVLSFTCNGQNGAGMALQVIAKYPDGTAEPILIELDANNDANYILPLRVKNTQFIGFIPVIHQKTGSGFTYTYSIEKLPGLQLSHTPLAAIQDSTGPYPVNAVIRSVGEPLDLSGTKVIYWTDSITDSVALALTGGDSAYTAEIPYPGNYTAVRYYLKVRDSSGYEITMPSGAPGNFYEFSVGADVIAPKVTILNYNRIPIAQEFPLSISAIVSDDSGIDSVFIRLTKNSVPFGETRMTAAANDTFTGWIAMDSNNLVSGDSIEFSITAVDLSPFTNSCETENRVIYVVREFIIEKTISKAIPDNNVNGVSDSLILAVSESYPALAIADMDVIFGATHPFIGDLSAYLTSPAGMTKSIMFRPGPGTNGSAGDNPDIILDDEASTRIEDITHTGTQTVTGTYKPFPDSLGSFDGQNVAGSWIMKVRDHRTTNTGTWTKWGLRIRTIAQSVTSVTVNENETKPVSFGLLQNYPNPFNPATSIRYTIPERSKVSLAVYNILGQKVADIVNSTQSQGHYTVQWNGKDSHGSAVSSGVYFYRLTAGKHVTQKKMLLIK